MTCILRNISTCDVDNIGIAGFSWYYFNMNREEIIAKLQAILPEVKERYHVKSMGIFGSVARGEQHKKSDVDILVEFHQYPSLLGLVKVEHFLSKKLHQKVDLVLKDGLKRAIKKQVLEQTIYV